MIARIPTPSFEGQIKSWNDDRGFGFITPDHGDQEIFFHIKSFHERSARPEPGQRVSFEVEAAPDGRKRASKVRLATQRVTRPTKRPHNAAASWGTATLFAIPAFLAFLLVAGFLWRVPAWVPLAYLGMSLLCYAAYAQDKRAAKAGAWRTPESFLHFLSFSGGWPGALFAQQRLRHKSVKASFRAAFWLSVLANLSAFVLVFSPWAARLLRA